MRIVLDTNQLVAALARPPGLATFIMAWESGRFTVVASPELIEEYLRVFTYPEVATILYPELLRAFHSHLMEDIEMIELPEIPRLCRDPDDDKVIATAIYGISDYIVTIDGDLLTRKLTEQLNQLGIRTISGSELVMMLDQQQ